jgi:hypothetical protein
MPPPSVLAPGNPLVSSASPRFSAPSCSPTRQPQASLASSPASGPAMNPVRRFAACRSHMRHRTDDQKSAYVSLACLRYAAKPLLASKGELPWHESKPRRKITPATEGPHCRCEGFNRQSNHRPDTRHGLKTPCRAVDSGKLGELLRFRLDTDCLLVDLCE